MKKNKKILLITISAWLSALAFACPPAEAQSSAYVTNILSNDASVINTANNTVVTTVSVGTDPVGVAITPSACREDDGQDVEGNGDERGDERGDDGHEKRKRPCKRTGEMDFEKEHRDH